MFNLTLVLGGLFFVFANSISQPNGYKFSHFSRSECLTHKAVPPPPIVQGKNPLLFIGLASNIAGESSDIYKSSFLTFKSKGVPLTLKDSNGFVYKSSEISISWKKVNLPSNGFIHRQVIGPFASFESADNALKKIKNNDKCLIIANPDDWEIWASIDFKIPKGMQSRKEKIKVINKIIPVLNTEFDKYSLKGPLEILSKDGILWEGGVYSGPFLLNPDAYGSWTLIEKVRLEKYLQGVVPYEIGSNAPEAALSAQAVLARTWALANINRYLIDGYHLCSTTKCQVYKDPSRVKLSIQSAIKETKGKVLTLFGQPVKAFYHASNGGIMASVEEAWLIEPLPYLRRKIDGTKYLEKNYKLPLKPDQLESLFINNKDFYGSQHKLFRWTRTVNNKELNRYLKAASIDIDSPQEINVLRRGESGRVISLEILGLSAESKILLRVDSIRQTLRFLPSTLFMVKKLEEGLWLFQGGGFGHGAGLSQAGAIDLALQGWDTEQILGHYFPGTNFGPLPENWIAP